MMYSSKWMIKPANKVHILSHPVIIKNEHTIIAVVDMLYVTKEPFRIDLYFCGLIEMYANLLSWPIGIEIFAIFVELVGKILLLSMSKMVV